MTDQQDQTAAPNNAAVLQKMMEASVSIMASAKEGDIECCCIFFDRNNIPSTLRAGAHMSIGGILEAISMLLMRAGVSEVHQEKIREELAAWALERVQGMEAAEAAASDLVTMTKGGIIVPMSSVGEQAN